MERAQSIGLPRLDHERVDPKAQNHSQLRQVRKKATVTIVFECFGVLARKKNRLEKQSSVTWCHSKACPHCRQYTMKYHHATPTKIIENAREYLPSDQTAALEKTLTKIQQMGIDPVAFQNGLDIALVLTELKLGLPTVLAGLSKPVISLEHIPELVGSEVETLSRGALKLDEIENKNTGKIEPALLSKLLLAASKDVRIMLIKLATEICELRFLPEQEAKIQWLQPQTALSVFVPICHKLGLHALRWQVEDLSMKYLLPDEYNELKALVQKTREEREKIAEAFKTEIKTDLQKAGLDVFVLGRPKNFYRIYKKMHEKKLSFDQVNDMIAARVVCDSISDCYAALGILQNRFQTKMQGYTDYIAHPKENGYQSIHLDLKWNNQNCEAQIRTWKMHAEAEDGLAAHWEYKKYTKNKEFDQKLSITKQITDWLERQQDKTIMETLRIRFDQNKLFVFTPQSDLVELVENATPVDFAFAVHSSLGALCEKAKVNGKLVPLHHKLENGDVVEIIISTRQKPKRNWLSFVQTNKAIGRIKAALQIESIQQKPIPKTIQVSQKRIMHTILAKCCNPLPGDDITAFKTTKRKIVVHRANCINAQRIPSSKQFKLGAEQFPKQPYQVEIIIRAENKPGLLGKILSEIAKTNSKITATNATSDANGFSCRFTIQIKQSIELEKLLEKIKKLPGIQQAKRT